MSATGSTSRTTSGSPTACRGVPKGRPLQFEEGIEKTVRWYLDNQPWMDNITSGEYERYYEEMYQGR